MASRRTTRAIGRTRVVAPDGILDELHGLSVSLSERYLWQRAQATGFVLTGATPICTGIRLSTPVFTSPRLVTVTLEIDPEMSVEDVTELYASARRRLLGPKPRSISDRTANLIVEKALDPRAAADTLHGDGIGSTQTNGSSRFERSARR